MCVYLCCNKLAPAYIGLELGIGDSLLIKALSEASGTTPHRWLTHSVDLKPSVPVPCSVFLAVGVSSRSVLSLYCRRNPLPIPLPRVSSLNRRAARQMKDVKMDLTKAGDLGLLAAQSKGKQSVLCKPKPLTVHAVYHGFKAIASEKGNKSMDKKVGGLVCPFAARFGDT